VFLLQTGSSSAGATIGSIRVVPYAKNSSPAEASIFINSQSGVLKIETSVPAAILTTHARIFID
jgi:hypothetical protein